jgi:hypothetical protein
MHGKTMKPQNRTYNFRMCSEHASIAMLFCGQRFIEFVKQAWLFFVNASPVYTAKFYIWS